MSADSASRTVRSWQVRLVWHLTPDLSPPHLGSHVGQLPSPYAEFQIGSYVRFMSPLVFSRSTTTRRNKVNSLFLVLNLGAHIACRFLWKLMEPAKWTSDVPIGNKLCSDGGHFS